MKQQRPSLEALASAIAPKPRQDTSNVVPGHGAVGPPAPARRDRLPHVSVYLDKRVQKIIKEIALTYDRRPHDLYIEGIDLMLKRYGRPSIAELVPEPKGTE